MQGPSGSLGEGKGRTPMGGGQELLRIVGHHRRRIAAALIWPLPAQRATTWK